MNQKNIRAAIDSGTLIAWKPEGGRLARVRAVETGLIARVRAVPQRDSSRVQVVQATFNFDSASVVVNNRELEAWTPDTEHAFSLLNDREAFKADAMQAAALAGIAVVKIDPISTLVSLSGDEFQRICNLIAPPTEIIDEGASERYVSNIQNAAEHAEREWPYTFGGGN